MKVCRNILNETNTTSKDFIKHKEPQLTKRSLPLFLIHRKEVVLISSSTLSGVDPVLLKVRVFLSFQINQRVERMIALVTLTCLGDLSSTWEELKRSLMFAMFERSKSHQSWTKFHTAWAWLHCQSKWKTVSSTSPQNKHKVEGTATPLLTSSVFEGRRFSTALQPKKLIFRGTNCN